MFSLPPPSEEGVGVHGGGGLDNLFLKLPECSPPPFPCRHALSIMPHPPPSEGEVRAAAAKLIVFGFDGLDVNDHARRMIQDGEGGPAAGRWILPFTPHLSL